LETSIPYFIITRDEVKNNNEGSNFTTRSFPDKLNLITRATHPPPWALKKKKRKKRRRKRKGSCLPLE
jgi:hypothetical protein